MSRTTLLIALLTLVVGCKKHVETGDLPVGYQAAPPAAALPPVQAYADMKANFQRVHFDYDSATLDESSKQALAANGAIMMSHTSITLMVQGHCDERGTTDYNLALGDRRAQAVASYLKVYGVAPSRVKTISYGEEMPLVNGHSETAWSENRRAEFVIAGGEDPAVQGTASR
ncbi:MAG: peptidoglycan-associated lipoprotein Pal [Pseudomonadota bacterium]